MESLSSNGVESTRVEQMAQKQNKIAQNLLEDKLRELEKETTLSKLHYRIFIKQLRWELRAQLAKFLPILLLSAICKWQTNLAGFLLCCN